MVGIVKDGYSVFQLYGTLKSLHNPVEWFGASALCFLLWNQAVACLGAAKSSIYVYLIPVVTIMASSAMLREKINGDAILGTLLILGGLCIAEKKKGQYAVE